MRRGLRVPRSNGSLLSIGASIVTSLALVGCDSRFPVCKSDQECNIKPEGSATPASSARSKVCFDLRCVECHYDSDCREGEVCSGASRECKSLDPKAATSSGPAPGEPGSGVSPPGGGPRDPKAWEACVKQCANKDCIAKCDAQYE